MAIGFFILSLIPAVFGCFLVGRYGVRFFQSTRMDGEVTGFQKVKRYGVPLPIVRVPEENGSTRAVYVRGIDSLFYVFGPAIKGEIITVQIDSDDKENVRIYGLTPLLFGAFLIVPLLISLAFMMRGSFAGTQLVFMALFLSLLFGGVALMKFIQNHY